MCCLFNKLQQELGPIKLPCEYICMYHISIQAEHEWLNYHYVAEGCAQIQGEPRRRPASMGPQLDSCGRPVSGGGGGGGRGLQWGRNLTVAEGAGGGGAAR